jgi:DNA primase
MSAFEFLRERVDLYELAGRHTELRPSGKAYTGRCPHPDHQDQNPSFCVYPDGRFHCHGCGWHGDVTDLWAGVNALEPGIGAAMDLTREFGIKVPGVNPEAQRLAGERRRKEDEYLKQAEKLHEALMQDRQVTGWWQQRGFGEDLTQRFLLGAHKGAAVIPFWNQGSVEGFVRRYLEGEPKYKLQNAEKFVRGYRPLFIPGSAFGDVFLVEGYVDALALAALGYPAVAVGGTHMSDRQLDELRRLPGPIYILPDADESGDKAARDWVENLYPKAFLCPPNYEKENKDDD